MSFFRPSDPLPDDGIDWKETARHFAKASERLAARVAELERERDEARRALVTYGECYAGGAGVTVSDDEFAAALKTLTLARAAARKEE